MKVIVCGAGQVGYNIARYLAGAGNDVTVIDQRAELTQKIGESLDIQAITGFASHPEVLEQAGAEDAEVLIAVTLADEVNMVACQVGHSLFNVPTKIARIRHQSYLHSRWQDLFRGDAVRRRPGAPDRDPLRARLPDPGHAAAPADLPVSRPASQVRRDHPGRSLLRAGRGRPPDRR
jgi:glycine/D-amino acid oxidase-like deaminating enzyme